MFVILKMWFAFENALQIQITYGLVSAEILTNSIFSEAYKKLDLSEIKVNFVYFTYSFKKHLKQKHYMALHAKWTYNIFKPLNN